jgi:hypothetical protein
MCLLHFCINLYVTYMLLSASVYVFFRQLFWYPPCMYALACSLCYHGQTSELIQCWHHVSWLFIETVMFIVFSIVLFLCCWLCSKYACIFNHEITSISFSMYSLFLLWWISKGNLMLKQNYSFYWSYQNTIQRKVINEYFSYIFVTE